MQKKNLWNEYVKQQQHTSELFWNCWNCWIVELLELTRRRVQSRVYVSWMYERRI